MADKIFTADEHLNAIIDATANLYASSRNTADLVIAGFFRACQERIKFLNKTIKDLETEVIVVRNYSNKTLEILNSERAYYDKIAVENNKLKNKLANITRLYGIGVTGTN